MGYIPKSTNQQKIKIATAKPRSTLSLAFPSLLHLPHSPPAHMLIQVRPI